MGRRHTLIYESLQQCVYGNTLPPSFRGKAHFGLSRKFDTHGTALFSDWNDDEFYHVSNFSSTHLAPGFSPNISTR
jgi:hypothetical protein